MDIKSFLEENNYQIIDCGPYLKCQALWRSGSDISSVTIYKNEELVIDHVIGEHFNFKTLIGKVLGIEDKDKIEEYLSNKNFIISTQKNEIIEPLIVEEKSVNPEFLNKLDKNNQEYWLNRKISPEVLKELGGGVYKNKYYFPVWNSKNKLLGWQYRNLAENCEKRYSIRGEKKNFVYPAFICSKDIISSKKVYLHEGIPDMMSAMTVGVRNNLVQFGTEISFNIINYLLKIPDIQIFICQNNDDAGRNSSIKIRKKLCKYFDWYQVRVKEVFDPYKDLNDLLLKESSEMLKKWFETS